MENNSSSRNGGLWLNIFRLVVGIFSPIITILLGLGLMLLSNLTTSIRDLDAKVFSHMTNSNIHVSRAEVSSLIGFQNIVKLNTATLQKLGILLDDLNE